jgi:tricorn protease
MWADGRIYFVSDRSGTFNLHAYDPLTRDVQQLTDYQTYGIDHAAAGAGVIAFVQDGQVRILNRQTGAITDVEIQIEPSVTELAPRTVGGAAFIQSARPSASGDRVVFGVRGEVVMLDIETGTTQSLTQTPGAAERYPTLSPNGEWAAYFSDESGNYQLYLKPLAGDGPVRTIPVELQSSFYRELVWSPDSKRLAFTDKRLRLWVVDLETGGARRVTTSTYSFQDRYYPSWSPDGVWLAYSRYESNRLRAVYLYNAELGRQRRITHGRVNAEHPTFDGSGRYLYFVASNTASLGEFGWDVLSGLLLRPYAARRLHVVSMRESVPPPVYPISGEPVEGAAAQATGGPGAAGQRPPGPQRAQSASAMLAGIENRVVPLPVAAKDFADLATGEPGVLYILVTEWPPSPTFGTEPTRTLYKYELAHPSELTRLAENVDDFTVTADAKKVLYRSGVTWSLISTSDLEAEPVIIDTHSLQVEVDQHAEWSQMYHEAWRLMKDFFYDPDHHGQDLFELESHYAEYLPSLARRSDLTWLLRKALGHISASHITIGEGDVEPPAGEPSRIGMLGADYVVDAGFYRFARIFRSGHYNSESRLAQAPLDQHGVSVRPGEFLLAVDGESVRADRNVYSYFVGKAMQPVRITVGPDTSSVGARTYTVVPLPAEDQLRRWNWAEGNRQLVEEESQGILGYIYVPDFSASGIVATFRQLLESTDRRGLVIDQRFAHGGITADYLIEVLQRRALFYYTFRQGEDLPVPTNPMPEAKVLLVNDVNTEAAESFALMFKLGNLGRVMGTRTWGAGVGPYVYIPALVDGGTINIPSRAAYDPAGSWGIENMGVDPDIEVPWSAAEWRQGTDPQLAAAIRAVLQAIVDRPPLEVSRPEYPVHGQQQQ